MDGRTVSLEVADSKKLGEEGGAFAKGPITAALVGMDTPFTSEDEDDDPGSVERGEVKPLEEEALRKDEHEACDVRVLIRPKGAGN